MVPIRVIMGDFCGTIDWLVASVSVSLLYATI